MTSRNGGKRDRQNQFFRATAMSPIGTIEPDSVIESGSFSMNQCSLRPQGRHQPRYLGI
jgi:hypothetical protein